MTKEFLFVCLFFFQFGWLVVSKSLVKKKVFCFLKVCTFITYCFVSSIYVCSFTNTTLLWLLSHCAVFFIQDMWVIYNLSHVPFFSILLNVFYSHLLVRNQKSRAAKWSNHGYTSGWLRLSGVRTQIFWVWINAPFTTHHTFKSNMLEEKRTHLLWINFIKLYIPWEPGQTKRDTKQRMLRAHCEFRQSFLSIF